ncbi:MAG: hypothetical protein IPK04_08325, partial [Bdellovibrionales bacterium]|nr:hypothetical protein [Bdellovibrionales bacterium]
LKSRSDQLEHLHWQDADNFVHALSCMSEAHQNEESHSNYRYGSAKSSENNAKEKITQRQLARLVPGLSQDRVSKIFNGHLGHMSIDKLVEINSALKIKVSTKATQR